MFLKQSNALNLLFTHKIIMINLKKLAGHPQTQPKNFVWILFHEVVLPSCVLICVFSSCNGGHATFFVPCTFGEHEHCHFVVVAFVPQCTKFCLLLDHCLQQQLQSARLHAFVLPIKNFFGNWLLAVCTMPLDVTHKDPLEGSKEWWVNQELQMVGHGFDLGLSQSPSPGRRATDGQRTDCHVSSPLWDSGIWDLGISLPGFDSLI